MKLKLIYLFLIAYFLISCREEQLSEKSVVELGKVEQNYTPLDKWIEDSITKPYNISVEYRWDKNHSPQGSYTYPPDKEKVKEILQTIKYLWLELYTMENLGGKHFLEEKTPVKIYMYGGQNLDYLGFERINNPNTTNAEMSIYNVNDFNKKDADKVFILMRSVHHQFAKKLTEVIPYDRDKFLSISEKDYTTNKYLYDQVWYDLKNKTLSRKDFFSPYVLANEKGFYTLHSRLSSEDDFAEILSLMLTQSPKQISDAEKIAATPREDYNPEEQIKNNEKAKKAYANMIAKRTMVEEYFSKNFKFNLRRLQIISLQRIKHFLNN